MARTILVLSGEVGAGKSTLAKRLVERYGAHHVSTHTLLTGRLGSDIAQERRALQEAGERLDQETGGRWVREGLQPVVDRLAADAFVVVDSIRIAPQLEALREAYGRVLTHLHLHAPEAELAKRYANRAASEGFQELSSYAEVRENATERNVVTLANDADILINTAFCTALDVEVRAAAHLGFSGRDHGPAVDVIVGGEYGSEGKGNIAFYLAPEYDLLVRVGGPNAGHVVPRHNGTPFTHRLLPSGTQNCDAPLLLGPGAVIDVDTLLREIAGCGDGIVDADRLTIDPLAMIISKRDISDDQRNVKAIGSTGKGVGPATARRIRRRASVKLARDVRELRPYLGPASEVLQDAYARGARVLLEGTQGSMLSLYHGEYPHVTSRDTTVSGCLAEAGIPPGQVRRTIMVCRTYPIRVQSPEGATSGFMGQEIKWETLSERSGVPLEELLENEKGSVSGKQRRVAEFDWALLRKSAQLNGPTDIALTFADYIDIENRKARRLDQLTTETIRFIEEVERIADADVSLISTRFHPRSIIDRRHW
jgi:adenylosuccinate synthase